MGSLKEPIIGLLKFKSSFGGESTLDLCFASPASMSRHWKPQESSLWR